VVGLSVTHDREPRNNGRTDRDAVPVVDSCGPKEPCVTLGSHLESLGEHDGMICAAAMRAVATITVPTLHIYLADGTTAVAVSRDSYRVLYSLIVVVCNIVTDIVQRCLDGCIGLVDLHPFSR